MKPPLSRKIQALEHSATEEVDNLVKRMRHDGIDDIISLGVGEPCFDTPDEIKEAACSALRGGKTKYEPTAGDYHLREAIQQKLREENSMDTDVDDIIVTAGGKFAIFLACQAVLNEHDRILILDPAWVTYEPAAQIAGAEAIRVPCDEATGYQPDLDGIRDAFDPFVRLVVINSPCNPTGTVFEPDTIREIVTLAAQHSALVLSDEVYEYLCYGCETYSPASEFDNVITVNAFSKSYAMTGWRLGYVTAQSAIVQSMIKVYQHSTSCVTSFAQSGALEALTNPACRESSKAMVEGYSKRRSRMLELIHASDLLECAFEPKGAFYCFPSYRPDLPSAALARQLLEHAHVATVPGAAFGASGEGHLRLSYATDLDQISEALERIDAFYRQAWA